MSSLIPAITWITSPASFVSTVSGDYNDLLGLAMTSLMVQSSIDIPRGFLKIVASGSSAAQIARIVGIETGRADESFN